MICERCGNPYRLYSPWDEPPENHYYHCDQCNRAWYPNLPEEFSYDEIECCASESWEVVDGE